MPRSLAARRANKVPPLSIPSQSQASCSGSTHTRGDICIESSCEHTRKKPVRKSKSDPLPGLRFLIGGSASERRRREHEARHEHGHGREPVQHSRSFEERRHSSPSGIVHGAKKQSAPSILDAFSTICGTNATSDDETEVSVLCVHNRRYSHCFEDSCACSSEKSAGIPMLQAAQCS